MLAGLLLPIIAVQTSTLRVHAKVDPGMELLAVYLWMSGKYPTPADSDYKTDVWKHFGKYRSSAWTKAARTAQRMFPDFTETGLWLDSERFVAPKTSSWYTALDRATVDAVQNSAIRFAAGTGFWKFFAGHRKEYDAWCRDFEERAAKDGTLEKLDGFYRYDAQHKRPSVTIFLEPLNSWGAHAISFDRLTGEPNGDRVMFQLGFWGSTDSYPDTPVQFIRSRSIVPTVWHEGTHVYLHPLMTRYGAEIDKLDRLFNAEQLKSQNIGTWRYCFEENVVRAIVAVLVRKYDGEEAYKREVRDQTQNNGFIYVYQLAETIWNGYATKPETEGDFDRFFPQILKALEGLKGPGDAKPPTETFQI